MRVKSTISVRDYHDHKLVIRTGHFDYTIIGDTNNVVMRNSLKILSNRVGARTTPTNHRPVDDWLRERESRISSDEIERKTKPNKKNEKPIAGKQKEMEDGPFRHEKPETASLSCRISADQPVVAAKQHQQQQQQPQQPQQQFPDSNPRPLCAENSAQRVARRWVVTPDRGVATPSHGGALRRSVRRGIGVGISTVRTGPNTKKKAKQNQNMKRTNKKRNAKTTAFH